MRGARRYWLAFICLGISIYVAVKRPWAPSPAIRADGYDYHVWVRHILTGDLNFCSERSFQKTYANPVLNDITPPSAEGRCGNIYPPGVALAQLPFLGLGTNKAVGSDPSAYEEFVTIALPLVLFVLSLVMLIDILSRCGVGPTASNSAVAAITFGTGYFDYAVFDGSMSHIYSAFWVTVALWSAFRKTTWATALTILASVMLVLTRNTNILLFPLIVISAQLAFPKCRSWLRFVVRMAVGSAVGSSVQIALNRWFLGKWTLSSYGPQWFQFDHFYLRKVLFSYAKGLFVWYPVLVMATIMPLFYKRSRWIGAAVLSTILLYATLYGFWETWQLGASFGHRGFIELFPIVAVSFALALDAARWKIPALLLSGSLSLITVILMLAYWRHQVPISNTTSKQFWSVVRGDHLAITEIGLLFLSMGLLTVLCLLAGSDEQESSL
jgi:hypothetical protein